MGQTAPTTAFLRAVRRIKAAKLLADPHPTTSEGPRYRGPSPGSW